MEDMIGSFDLKDYHQKGDRVLLNGKELADERNNIILSNLGKPSFLVIEAFQKSRYIVNNWNLNDANDKVFFQKNQIFTFQRLKDDTVKNVRLIGKSEYDLSNSCKLFTFYFQFL